MWGGSSCSIFHGCNPQDSMYGCIYLHDLHVKKIVLGPTQFWKVQPGPASLSGPGNFWRMAIRFFRWLLFFFFEHPWKLTTGSPENGADSELGVPIMAVPKFQPKVFGGLSKWLISMVINKSPNWGNLPLPNGLCQWLILMEGDPDPNVS